MRLSRHTQIGPALEAGESDAGRSWSPGRAGAPWPGHRTTRQAVTTTADISERNAATTYV
jgi:hypothetical protein